MTLDKVFFTPETALEVAPLAGWAGGVARNLQPQSIRNWAYVSKAPIGYGGKKEALQYFIEGVLSGRPADIENPWWFNGNSAKALQEYPEKAMPEYFLRGDYDDYLSDFGHRALRARTDMWRMYNHIPQKYNTFTPSKLHPGAWTAEQDIRDLGFIPQQIEGRNQLDFVNSVGGNIGKPEIQKLGHGRTPADQWKEWGVTTTSDWFDLHPLSRPGDRIIEKYIQPTFRKFIGRPLERITGKEVLTPEFDFLKPLEEKVARFEWGRLIGSDPVLVQYDIPWTSEVKFKDFNGTPIHYKEFTPGFKSEDILPEEVKNWDKYYIHWSKPNIDLSNIINKTTK